MCSNIPASPAYGVYISQLIRYARAIFLRHTLTKKLLTLLTSVSLYIFTIWKCIAYNFFCRDGIYFDKILVSEYKLYRNESGRFGALKSDSTHHFFRNACTKSRSLRFSVFRLLTDFVCLYNYEFGVTIWLTPCWIIMVPIECKYTNRHNLKQKYIVSRSELKTYQQF
jgi:hypothetical protein